MLKQTSLTVSSAKFDTRLVILALACVCMVGCHENPGSEAGSTTGAATQAGSESVEAPAVTVTIQDWKSTEELIAQQKGKVVVLDLWSTLCEPCVREFPHLVALHNKYGDDKVVCISGSCDYEGLDSPEELLNDVRQFLIQQQATFHNVLFNIESDQLWSTLKVASIPVVYVYGPDGKLAKRFDNESGDEEFTYQKDIVPFVEELLAAADKQE